MRGKYDASCHFRHTRVTLPSTWQRVDDDGLHVALKTGERRVIPADTVVVCAGQDPEDSLHAPLIAAGLPTYLIGGAHVAAELDAKRAIDQGSRLAAAIESAAPERVGDYVAPLGAAAWLFEQIAARRRH